MAQKSAKPAKDDRKQQAPAKKDEPETYETVDSHDESKDSVEVAGEEVTPVDLEHERNIKVTKLMEEELAREPEEKTAKDVDKKNLRVKPVDVDHEHSLIQEEMASRTVPVEDAPSHREGEVWESMAPEDDAVGGGRRRVRVAAVEKGNVTVTDPGSGEESKIKAGDLCEPEWRRAHS